MRNADMMTANHWFRIAASCRRQEFGESIFADEWEHAHLEAVEQPTQERGHQGHPFAAIAVYR